jgi:plasmid stabilization system protein ParE
VTRVLITGPADADSAAIISDLATKAGQLVADRYDAEFDALYRRLESFPESGSPRPSLAGSFELGSCRRMS